MKYWKKMICVPLLLALLLCVFPAAHAVAAGEDQAWLNTQAADGSVVAYICVDTTVSDGLIEVRYDSAALTFVEVVADSRYVAAQAVNAEDAGVVRIAWLAPGDYKLDGTVHILLQVRFAGAAADSLALSGELHTPKNKDLKLITLDFAPLQTVIAQAEAQDREQYTAQSVAALDDALKNASAAMENMLITQTALDTAAQQLRQALSGLTVKPVEPTTPPTEPTQPTQPTEPVEPTEPTEPTAPTEPAAPTQPQAPAQPTQPNGNGGDEEEPNGGVWIWIVVAVLALLIVLFFVIFKKKKKEDRR